MKKTLLTLCLAAFAFSGMAQKVYNDNIIVSINGEESEPVNSNVVINQEQDGTTTLSLKNFRLGEMAVGNIVISGIRPNDMGSYKTIRTEQVINIEAGDDPTESWIGPVLEEVPVDLKGGFTDDKCFCRIKIDMTESLEEFIYVTFGTNQLMGKTTTYTEPLIVSINGEDSEPVTAVINVNEMLDGTSLTLNDFMLGGDEGEGDGIAVGNIELCGVVSTSMNIPGDHLSTMTLSDKQIIRIAEGNDPEKMWLGPMLEDVPVEAEIRYNDKQLVGDLVIDMVESLGEMITVSVGKAAKAEADYTPVIKYNDTAISFDAERTASLDVAAGVDLQAVTEAITCTTTDADAYIVKALADKTCTITVKPSDYYLLLNEELPETLTRSLTYTVNLLQDETGIQGLTTLQAGKTYDLAGRRVGNLDKGIYVKAGKKVIR